MSYAAGQTILDDEYNVFVTGSASGTPLDTTTGTNNVNALWATGGGTNGAIGYKQSGALAAVAAGSTVTATQWANLLNRIDTMANHQGSSITAVSNPTVGDTITAVAAISTNIDTIWSNRGNAAAVGASITSGGSNNFTTAWGGAGQNQTLDFVHIINFADEDSLEAFFNCGGRITHTCSRSGGTASNKNTAWTAAATAMGTGHWTGLNASKTIAGTAYTGFTKTGGSGTATVYDTATGVLTRTVGGAYTESHAMAAATSPYASNTIQRFVQRTTTTQVRILCRFNDDANSNTDESADGTFNSTVALVQPSTTYLSNSWGTPTISSSSSTS